MAVTNVGAAQPKAPSVVRWATLGVTFVVAVLVVVSVIVGGSGRADVDVSLAAALAVGFTPAGLFAMWVRPDVVISRLIWVVGVVSGLTLVVWGVSGWGAADWVSSWIWWPSVGLIPAVLFRFPDDAAWSRRRRLMSNATVLATGVSTVLLAAAGDHGVRSVVLLFAAILIAAVVVSAVVAMLGMILQARRSEPPRCYQYTCLIPAAIALPVGVVLDVLGVSFALVPAALALPIGLSLAVMQYRLADLDLYVRRGVVRLVLVLVILVVYAATLLVIDSLLPPDVALWVGAASLAAAAVALEPVRRALNRRIESWLFGATARPYTVLSSLAAQMQGARTPADMLTQLPQELTTSLRIPYAAVELDVGETPQVFAQAGREIPFQSFPMELRGRRLGAVRAAPRRLGERFTAHELSLLHDVARQAAFAADAVALTLALRQAREQLVLAREEERLRLRNDLHDGLGPLLAGTRMQLLAALGSIGEPAPRELVNGALGDLGDAGAAVREIIDGLRPTALDLGLAEALEQVSAAILPTRRVSLDVPQPLPPLPPAVEVAAFRIATEALANVAKHAPGATRAQITLRASEEALVVAVADSGLRPQGRDAAGGVAIDSASISGKARERPGGVGLRSMALRADELGGTLDVSSTATGTRVQARLPLR